MKFNRLSIQDLESLINITLATEVKAIIASVGIRGIRKVT
jgi:hypothetical protein